METLSIWVDDVGLVTHDMLEMGPFLVPLLERSVLPRPAWYISRYLFLRSTWLFLKALR